MTLLQALMPAVSRMVAPPMAVVARHNHPANVIATDHKAWGDFDYQYLPLHEPNELLPDSSRPLGAPRWYFGNCSRDELTSFINSFAFPAEHKATLLDASRWEPAGSGFYLSPPPEVVLELTQAARSRLYSILANYPENSPQCNPFRFRSDGFDQWFADSGLSAEPLSTLRQLTYTNGGTLCFCDGAIAQRLLSTNDFKRLVKALYGESTFLMRLRVTPESDIDAIVRYWSRGKPTAAIRPLLEALAKVPGGGNVTIAYLLPPFARLRLYTYPNPAADPTAALQNCFWTAMNFFNERPDPSFLKIENTRHTLDTDYVKTTESPVYGDLIGLVNSEDKLIHLCVYLADDVVFTKNGSDYMQPWVLMKIPDMMKWYVARTPVRMIIYRPKKP